MNQLDRDVAVLSRYLRTRGYHVGKGKIIDTIMNVIIAGDEEATRALIKILDDPRQSAALFELASRDLNGGRKPPKKKVRRGVGSY